ncbi:hypothetical protein HPB50_010344 [Hyalomma asiaticum]|uniref:Uncharacterized protein n=1 Tax=Hyalomma asiaticum TaxID=266040 RepID=A0ACB7TIB3_HYAAI|nr:hypothetical protein HPB50_010344 [Hyalomma asiaticum]
MSTVRHSPDISVSSEANAASSDGKYYGDEDLGGTLQEWAVKHPIKRDALKGTLLHLDNCITRAICGIRAVWFVRPAMSHEAVTSPDPIVLPERELQRQVLGTLNIIKLTVEELSSSMDHSFACNRPATAPASLVLGPFETVDALLEFEASLRRRQKSCCGFNG